jgi:excisionase family DNA binding protein
MESYTTSQRMAWGLGEVAEFTGLSLAFVRNEVRAGRLPFRRFGRRVLIRDEDLQKYLAAGSPGDRSCETAAESESSGSSAEHTSQSRPENRQQNKA